MEKSTETKLATLEQSEALVPAGSLQAAYLDSKPQRGMVVVGKVVAGYEIGKAPPGEAGNPPYFMLHPKDETLKPLIDKVLGARPQKFDVRFPGRFTDAAPFSLECWNSAHVRFCYSEELGTAKRLNLTGGYTETECPWQADQPREECACKYFKAKKCTQVGRLFFCIPALMEAGIYGYWQYDLRGENTPARLQGALRTMFTELHAHAMAHDFPLSLSDILWELVKVKERRPYITEKKEKKDGKLVTVMTKDGEPVLQRVSREQPISRILFKDFAARIPAWKLKGRKVLELEAGNAVEELTGSTPRQAQDFAGSQSVTGKPAVSESFAPADEFDETLKDASLEAAKVHPPEAGRAESEPLSANDSDAQAQREPEEKEEAGWFCTRCGAPIDNKQWAHSMDRLNLPVCAKCEQEEAAK